MTDSRNEATKPTAPATTAPRLRPLPPEMPYPSRSNILLRTPDLFPPKVPKEPRDDKD